MKRRITRKKRWRALVVAFCTLALAVTPVFAAWGDTTSGEMEATNQTFVDANNRQIKSFKLNNLYSYETLGADSGKTTLTLSTSTLQKIVKERLLPQWSGVAASVFRDQAGQLVDLYGYMPNEGSMTQAGFDAYFNMSRSGNETYKDEVWSCYSLKSKLAQVSGSHAGKAGYDQLTVTGVRQVNSLSQARSLMGQALRDCENNDGLSAEEFIDADEAGETRLDGLNDGTTTTGFANVVTAVNCKGKSANFDYVSFGIVFYDFEPVPVAAQNLDYVALRNGTTPGDPTTHSSEIRNAQQQDIVHSAKLGNTVTETTTATLSGLASAKLSQNIGASIGCSETETTEDWSFGPGDDDTITGSSSSSSETTSMGLNWGAAWEMAGALGAEMGHSKSVEVSKAVETTIALPPHTATTIEQTASTTTYAQSYQQPVVLNYKVAIYAMSGDFYSSSAFGGIGGINAGGYDKQSLVIKFDTKGKSNLSYGCAATDDLYSRAVSNLDVPGYDTSNDRTYTTHSTAKGFRKSEDINWYNVINDAKGYYNEGLVSAVATKNYFYETDGKLTIEQDKTSSSAESLYPLYDLAEVRTPKTHYVLYRNNTLERSTMSVTGFNRFNVPFYGFSSKLGEWNRCDEQGNIVEQEGEGGTTKYGELLPDDPVVLEGLDTLKPRPGTQGGTIYLRWVSANDPNKPLKTGEHPEGQDLNGANRVMSPVVTITVVNSGLDNPKVTASGSYIGYFGTPINLRDVITWEVVDNSDKRINVPVRWESRENVDDGIEVNEATGDVEFKKPGNYLVRPFVWANPDSATGVSKKVYSNWLPIVATEHDLVHYDAKAPTNCVDGNADGWIEHYRCSDCRKYFSDVLGTTELAQNDVIIPALGHNWGDWTVVSESPDDNLIVEQRVCANNPNHTETRDVSTYTVEFSLNGIEGTAPDSQIFRSDIRASVEVPSEPKAAGWTFEGWYKEPECATPYDFGATVTDNMMLYAKWEKAKFTIATVAVVDETTTSVDGGSQQKITPATDCSIYFNNVASDEKYTDGDGYTYYYKEVAFGDPVELTVAPAPKFGLKEIQAAPVMSVSETDISTGDSFEPTYNEATGKYELTMPAADVAVVGSFAQEYVTVTYNGGKLAGNVTVPAAYNIEKGTTPSLDAPTGVPETHDFVGWFTDEDLKTPCLANTSITKDTTLYAKWIEKAQPPTMRKVTYTLVYKPTANLDPDVASYQVEEGSTAYNPTEDVYDLAGADAQAQYKLLEGGKSCWFEGLENAAPSFETAESFDFDTQITEDTYLYAQVVPKTYTVTYYDGDTKLGSQEIEYNSLINKPEADAMAPTKEGQELSGWSTNGTLWNFEEDRVTSNLALYANWSINVTFDANGHGTAPDAQNVNYSSKVQKPDDPTADGYTFGGWFTDPACTKAYNFDTPVTGNLTLYAKWTAEKRTVTFDANGHGTAPAAQTVDYGNKAQKPAGLTAEGYVFGGWFTDQPCTQAYDFGAAVTNNLRLYAKWTADSKDTPEPQPGPEQRTKLAPATWDRLWGETALDTMSHIVEAGSFESGGTVVLATFDGYWDALTAAGIAGKLNAPVLMTPASGLSAQTRSLLESLRPTRIVVCGGTGALPDGVAEEAAAVSGAQIVRCAGQTAVNTAESIAAEAQRLSGRAWADTAFLCTNDGYWDALAAAPISYARNMPIFLVNGHDAVEGTTLDAMRAAGVRNVCLVGGEAAISPAAEQAVRDAGFNVSDRFGGENAIETSELVASYGLSLNMTADYMGVATVGGYWDALAGAPLCGKMNSVLVLAAGPDSHSISGFIKDHDLSIVSGYVFGGKAAIDVPTYDAIVGATATVPNGNLAAQSSDLVAGQVSF